MPAEFAPAWLKAIQFVEEFGENPSVHGSISEIGTAWEKILSRLATQYNIPPPDDSVQTEDVTLDNFWLRVYKPQSSTESSNTPNHQKKTVGVYIHGGGWALGSVDQEDAITRLISKTFNMTLVSVSYRLAPEHKYPSALDDCLEAVDWVLKNLNATSILLTGPSAGGNLSFGTALKLIDQGRGDIVKGVVALVPVTIHPDLVSAEITAAGLYDSYDINADATVNSKSAMSAFFNAYNAPSDDVYTSCLLHPKLKELKKVYIAECGADTLRDDARLMKDALEKARVPVVYRAYPGFPHYSWTYPSSLLDEHRREFLGDMLDGIKWVLGDNGSLS
ncbi:Alpha/Beta hydrolase protein [Aspergillus karnatakaensis]|uniref:alpha/beta hydrolase n=1 Tax=Aspergillus karnatakaensis TaxID=1810916 RepID=UPI003CCE3A46